MPLYHAISVGNANIVIFLGFCIIYWGIYHNKTQIISLTLAVITFLKIFPVIFLIVFVRYKMWRVIWMYLLYMTIGLFISFLIFGIQEHIHFAKNLTTAIPFIGPLNTSFVAILKLFLPSRYQPYHLYINIIFSFVLFGIWFFARKNTTKTQIIVDLLIVQVIMLLIIPYSWYQYNLFLIIPFSFIFLSASTNEGLKYFIFLCLMPFFLINFWEIFVYHIPLTANGLTAIAIFEKPYQHPALYKLIGSALFCSNLLIFFLLLLCDKKFIDLCITE